MNWRKSTQCSVRTNNFQKNKNVSSSVNSEIQDGVNWINSKKIQIKILMTQLRKFKFNIEFCNFDNIIMNENKRVRVREIKHNRL